jgi:hypothetical protein
VQSAEDVVAVAADLRSPQPAWEALGPAGRAVWLRKLRNWVLDNESRLAFAQQGTTNLVRPSSAPMQPDDRAPPIRVPNRHFTFNRCLCDHWVFLPATGYSVGVR